MCVCLRACECVKYIFSKTFTFWGEQSQFVTLKWFSLKRQHANAVWFADTFMCLHFVLGQRQHTMNTWWCYKTWPQSSTPLGVAIDQTQACWRLGRYITATYTVCPLVRVSLGSYSRTKTLGKRQSAAHAPFPQAVHWRGDEVSDKGTVSVAPCLCRLSPGQYSTVCMCGRFVLVEGCAGGAWIP